jgi:anti-sigma factor RsiW
MDDRAIDCAAFAGRLDAFEEGTLDRRERRRLDVHLATCERCQRLVASVRGELDVAAGGNTDFVDAVLSRTTGRACERVAARLCDFVDGALAGDEELLSAHLAHCASCTSLERAVREAAALLPALALLEPPDPAFTSDVIAATAGRVARRRMAGRVRGWWASVLERPRFAWEAAYVGTLLLALVFGDPAAAFRRLSPQALVSQAGASAPFEQIIGGAVTSVWNSFGGRAIAEYGEARLSQFREGYRSSEGTVAWLLNVLTQGVRSLLNLDTSFLWQRARAFVTHVLDVVSARPAAVPAPRAAEPRKE